MAQGNRLRARRARTWWLNLWAMKLKHGLHLAYCTNVHRGETWAETFAALQAHTLAVRQRVCPGRPYAIGLRLSDAASRELSEPSALKAFRQWLEANDCYVFTINGFPYGRFHGARVKEQVYAPDWTTAERLAYTNRLFDLLAQLAPPGVEGSVSTVPGSFKDFITRPDQVRAMRENLWRCVEHIAALSERTGQQLNLGLEPEPLCYLETSEETVRWFEQLRADRPNDPRLDQHLGVNYDTCHLAVEFEQPADALRRFTQHGVKLSKVHLSAALKLQPTAEALQTLGAFADDTYLHQVVVRDAAGRLTRYRDLCDALASDSAAAPPSADSVADSRQWRVHFHIPLHSPPGAHFESTADHLLGLLDLLQATPSLCSHLEMETYTWEVLPAGLKTRSVVDQLVGEYEWTLARLAERGFTPCT
jgi:hypothetical protein